MSQAKRLLRKARLLTLTGSGGVGKTRLAMQVAADLGPRFADGVWFVDLSAVEDGELVAETASVTVGIRSLSDQPPVELLCAYLKTARALIVLDGCEHLRPACADLVGCLLQAAPGLRILATSRQTLGMYGETIMSVPPLAVPEPYRPRRVAATGRYEAVKLFSARAAAVAPDFALDAANHETVSRLCQRLEGLPLAIELAAVQLRWDSPETLLRKLEDHLEPLGGADGSSAPRHQTLRASIDWSFDLCSPAEQALWSRVSVFAGSFDMDAAEAVCSGDGIAPSQVVDLMAGLLDKSVLIRQDTGSQVRYRLLDTLRRYGRARFATSEQEAGLRRRHRDWYYAMAVEAEGQWVGPEEAAWLSRLQAEHANIRAALEFCVTEPGQAQAGMEFMSALWIHWICSGSLNEGRHWLGRLLALVSEPSAARAEALWLCSLFHLLQGSVDEAIPLLQASEALAGKLDDQLLAARVAHGWALSALLGGEPLQAVPLLRHALDGYRAGGLRIGEMLALYGLATACSVLHDPRAADFGEECLGLCDAHGAPLSRSYALWAMGLDTLRRGDPQQAGELVQAGLRLRWPMNDRWGVTLSIEVLAWTAASRGQAERGAKLLGAADTMWHAVGSARPRHLVGGREQAARELQQILGRNRFDEAFRRGAVLTLDQAVTYALDEPAERPGGPA
ncbi:NB-ARC domain-containing protein [Kitasatospora sp. NBC_00240]|uniref:ATP-binding protein n=1 Tax=Kitasatospora sp. NBC_00240 TaxID=2903567 RepID=UPI00225A6E73|nr:NB-ARC domain-containing protein [Kitasatospora sp. NBC_00240]MCX5208355.1 NB-ARC domain-containing protein [Kitasatospora sp. NBC_00240]